MNPDTASNSPSVDSTATSISNLIPNSGQSVSTVWGSADSELLAEITKFKYTENYQNDQYKFVFKYPTGFSAIITPSDYYDVLVVQNSEKKIGLQILISPLPSGFADTKSADSDLSAGVVESSADVSVSSPQAVTIGGSKGKGLAFDSSNESFGGKSYEVWFIHAGHLYQISTYKAFAGFLKGLMKTWIFK